ncbi:DUF1707 domain-containing protein [Jiangella mangrovi]|uniref:DUF1707 domain-containing protein n=1 Tax=Jiangella mangrovi TaxID=1524084 RepID=A0A7W9LLD4_9ACTN|nr:hypothetical protein [Jiangella mangrovi]
MSRPDRRWRPSDADRDRYAGAISQAFAEGRIDATDMESRTALVYEATSIADLDALVEDMPAPAPAATPAPAVQHSATRSSGIGVGWVIGAVAIVLVVMFAVLSTITSGTDSPEPPPPAVAAPLPEPLEPPEPPAPDPADLPDIATDQLGLFTVEGLRELWTAVPAAGHTDVESMTIFADRAYLVVRADSSHRALARFDYQGGLAMPAEPYRDLGDYETDAETFFSWGDVTPEAVMAAHDAMPAVTGLPDVTVAHISVDEDADGVTINVYPEGDTGIGYVKFDASGQLIRTY